MKKMCGRNFAFKLLGNTELYKNSPTMSSFVRLKLMMMIMMRSDDQQSRLIDQQNIRHCFIKIVQK